MKKLISTIVILVLFLIKLQAQSCFTPIWTGYGLDQMNFYITGATVNGLDMQAGDEIGVFDGNDCVGVGLLTQVLTPSTFLSFVASKDDIGTPIKDGFTEGNAISFRLCTSSGVVVVTDVTAVYTLGSGSFSGSGTAMASLSGFTVPPSAPTIGTITPPTCIVATGSVIIEGLPATGTWTLTTNPGGTTTPGTGTSTTISELSSGTYTFTVTDGLGATSDPSLDVIIIPQPTIPVPAGTITGTASVCQGSSSIAYSVPAITNATSYTWSYSGTGATITNETTNSITISFDANATSGNLTVRGVNACGNGTVSSNYAITVNPLPIPAGTITGTASVCQGSSSIAYNVPVITNATSYLWSYTGTGATITNETTNSITISFDANATSGNLTVRGVNACGNGTASADYPIVVNPLPVAASTITGTAAVCQGSSSIAYNVPAITNATSYTWSYSGTGATISNGTTNSITISFDASATSGNLTVRGVNACGNGTVSANYPIVVNPLPIAAGTITGTASVCQGQSVVAYSVPAITNATSYTWSYSGTGATITSGTTNSITISFDANATSGNLTVRGVNACGNGTASANYPIVVNPLPVAAGTITGTAVVCQGSSSISYNVPAITNATSYTWSYSGTGATISGSTNPITISFASNATSGNLAVRGVNACGNGTLSAAYPITVNAIPTITGVNSGSRCGPGTVALSATASAGVINWYTGLSGGASLYTGASFTTPVISTNTSYYVDATSNGCTTPARTMVLAIVNTVPTITNTTPASRCGTGSVTLGATPSAGTVNWYSAEFGGGSLGSGITYSTPSIGTSTTYWVDATNLGCTSPTRTSVTATINAVPATPVHTVDCSLGFNHARILVTSPIGAGYQYRLNSGSYQTSPEFTEVINGSYTVTVVNSANCTTTGTSFEVSCGCVNGPTVTLSSVSGSTCGTAPVTVANNTFGGSATSVTIIENGAGTVSPVGTVTTPFAFTYTPGAGDIGNTVTITVTTDNPLGDPCTAATATYTLTVNTIPTISGTTPGSRCGTGTVTLVATASAGTVNWYSASTGGTSLWSGTSFTTPVISPTTTYYVDATNNGCTTAGRTPIIATVLQAPSPAGPITGSATFTPGTAGVPYSVAAITGATGYTWAYSGTGVTIIGSGTSVTLDFAANATLGQLSVRGTNTCGQGTASILDLSPANKTLNLTSVFLEGLYNSAGTMRQAYSESGPRWTAGIADHITIELHNSSSYSTIIYSATDVNLTTSGTATVTVPSAYSGSYYITIKHRNSIETTTASPVSFAGTVINRVFGSTVGIFGANLKASGDGYFLIFGGDVNQDGFVDSGDYPGVVNDNFNYVSGYLPTDINGDGFIDSGDYPIMVNNNFSYVGIIHP